MRAIAGAILIVAAALSCGLGAIATGKKDVGYFSIASGVFLLVLGIAVMLLKDPPRE